MFLNLLTSISIFHALVIAVKKLSIEQLDSDDSKNEMKKKIDNEDVEDILEGVDDTVKHCLQFGDSLDGLQWPEHSQYSQWFNHTKIFSCCASTEMKIHLKSNAMGNSFNLTLFGGGKMLWDFLFGFLEIYIFKT